MRDWYEGGSLPAAAAAAAAPGEVAGGQEWADWWGEGAGASGFDRSGGAFGRGATGALTVRGSQSNPLDPSKIPASASGARSAGGHTFGDDHFPLTNGQLKILDNLGFRG